MANIDSAIKRHRQSLKANARNRAMKTRIRNAIKAVRVAIESKDVAKAEEALSKAASVMDKAAGKKIIHWRTAARKVSRLSLAIGKLKA